jgi:hypothetical protein
MVQDRGEPTIPPLGHPSRMEGRFLLALVVVDVEVVRLDRMPFEALVLDRVLAEVGGRRRREQSRKQQNNEPNGLEASRHDSLEGGVGPTQNCGSPYRYVTTPEQI